MAAPPGPTFHLVAALGSCALALAASWLVPNSLFPGARVLAFSLSLVLCAGISLRMRGSAKSRPTAHRDHRPADGRVGLARLDPFLSEPNPVDPRFGRFIAIKASRGGETETRPTRERTSARCPPLLGRVVIVSVFLGRVGRGWPPGRIARSHDALLRVGRWIEREAIRWDAPVNIEVARTYFATEQSLDNEIDLVFDYEKGRLSSFEKHEIERALLRLNLAAVRLGFRHGRHLVETTEAAIDADAVVWLVHPWLAGRSFAVPVDLPNAVAVNLAVCYPSYADLPEPLPASASAAADPTSVAHELFHLFGASDKYNQSLRSFGAGFVTSRDVMRLRESRLSRLRVDRQTAFEVGWLVSAHGFETE